MKVIIEHKNKVVEFYDVPAKVANSIESLLHAIEIELDCNICGKKIKAVG